MKKIKLALALALSLSTLNSPAQTTNAPVVATNTPAVQNFLDTVTGWFTSSNPDLTNTFGTNKTFTIEVGADYVQGAQTASSFIVEYNFGKFSVESATRNSPGIAQGILSQEIGFGYAVRAAVDLRIRGYVDLGYSWSDKCGLAEIGLEAQKALSQNTFAYMRFGEPILFKGGGMKVPGIGAGVGVTF